MANSRSNIYPVQLQKGFRLGQKYLTRENKKAYTVFGGLAYKSNFKLGIAVLQQKSGVAI